MVWAVRVDGVTNYLELSSSATINTGNSFDIEFELRWDGGDFCRPFGEAGTLFNRCLIYGASDQIQLRNNAGDATTWTTDPYTKTDFNVFRFVRDTDGVTTELFINGSSQGSLSFSGAIVFNRLFLQSATVSNESELKYLTMTNGAISTYDWDATLSDHNSTTLSDFGSIGIDATFTGGMTAANWLDLGGADNNSIIDLAIPAPEFSFTATSTPPAGNVSLIDFAVPVPEFNFTAEVTAPVVSSEFNFNVPTPEFSFTAKAFEPGSISTINFRIPAPEFSFSVSVEAPEISGILAGRLTASLVGDYSAKSIRIRSEAVNLIKLQFNIADEITEIEYLIDRFPKVIKTLSNGGIVEDDGYKVILDEEDTKKLGYYNHYVTITTSLGKIKASLNKGRIYVQ